MHMRTQSPARQLAGFIDKFNPEIAKLIKAARGKMRARLPGARELVYDNYNFFVIGYGPTDKTSDALFSLAAYAKGLNLFFLQGASLPDPDKLLLGSGKQVRSIRVTTAGTLDLPAVRALITSAVQRAEVPFDAAARPRLIIKAVSAKQRPRR